MVNMNKLSVKRLVELIMIHNNKAARNELARRFKNAEKENVRRARNVATAAIMVTNLGRYR